MSFTFGERPKLTEFNVQDAIYWSLHQSGYRLICPNYTPSKWWECDIFAVTKSGYWIEFEIKLTLSDFKADSKKEKERFVLVPGGGPNGKSDWKEERQVKHELLSCRSDRAPSRFYYVAPENMINPMELPEWAGLMEFQPTSRNIYLTKKIKAPRLHNEPVKQKILDHVQLAFYWRYWTLRQNLKSRGVKFV